MATKTITGIKAGTTVITATYGGKTSSVTFTVNAIAPSLTFNAAGTLIYNGATQKLGTISYTGDGQAKYYVSTTDSVPSASASGWVNVSSGGDIISSAATATTYYVYFQATAGTNYTAVSPYKAGSKAIGKRTVNVTAAPTVVSTTLKYNNNNQTLLNAGSISAGGTLYYYVSTSSTTPSSFSTSSWSTSLPTGKNAGTYYLWYYGYVADTTNNTAGTNANTIKSLGPKSIDLRDGAAPSFSASSVPATCASDGASVNTSSAFTAATAGHSGTISYSVQSAVLNGSSTQLTGWNVNSSRIISIPAQTTPGTYKVTIRATEAATSTDSSSYKDAVITVTLSKLDIQLTLTNNPSSKTIIYNNTGTITVSGGHPGTISASSGTTSVATVSTNGSVVTVQSKTAGSSEITVTAAATTYVNASTAKVTWTVNRRTGTAPTFNNSSVSATCNSAHGARTTGAFTAATAGHSGTLSYSLVSVKNSGGTELSGWYLNADRTITIPANTVAGTYTCVVRATEAQTSTDSSSTKDATITVELSKYSYTITLDKSTLSLIVSNTGTITASGYEGTLSVASNKTAVATVSLSSSIGTVTAVSTETASATTGTATITFSATATSYANAATGTATVTVSKRTGAAPTFNNDSVAATCVQSGASVTSGTFAAATAGHGGTISSYSLISAKNSSNTSLSGWSVGGTNGASRTIVIPKDTVSGTYTCVVRVTEAQTSTDSSSTKDATITVELSKGTQTLNLDKTSLTLTYPTTGTITASGYSGTLTVSSLTTSVATASNAAASTITPVGQGTSTIKFIAAATSYVNQVEKTATVTVNRRTGAAPTFNNYEVSAECTPDQSSKITTAFAAATAGHGGGLTYTLTSIKNSGGSSLSGWSIGTNANARKFMVPANTKAGTYTAVVTVTEAATSTDSESTASATITIKMNKGSQQITLTCDPSNHTSTYNANGTAGTITASNHVGTISATSATPAVATVSVVGSTVTVTCVKAGSSVITVTAAGNDYVNSVSDTVTWTISKAASTLPSTWSGDSVDTDHTPATLTATGYTGGTLQYRYDTNGGTSYGSATTTAPTRTTIGSTTVQCMVVGDDNHSNSSWSSAVTLTVYAAEDARMTVTPGSGLTYDGYNKTIATASNPHGVGTYYLGYKKDSQATAYSQITWGTASTTQLTAIDAGIYYIYYRFTPDGNHSNSNTPTSGLDTATYVGSATINKGSRSGAVSCEDTTYPATVQASVSVSPVAWTGGTVTWSITNGTGEATISSTGVVTPVKAGTVTVKATVGETANYTAYTATAAPITIGKAAGTITYSTSASVQEYCTSSATAISQADANKTITIASASATNATGSISYAISQSGWSIASDGKTITVPKNTAAGTYSITVSATSAATANYTEKTVTNNLTVNLTAVTLSSIAMTLNATTVSIGNSTSVKTVIASYSNGATKDVASDAGTSYSADPDDIVEIS